VKFKVTSPLLSIATTSGAFPNVISPILIEFTMFCFFQVPVCITLSNTFPILFTSIRTVLFPTKVPLYIIPPSIANIQLEGISIVCPYKSKLCFIVYLVSG